MRTLGLIVFSCVYLLIKSEENRKQSCVESCKEGEQERFGEHCYYWSTKRVHWPPQVEYWDYAKLECESMNGSLAAITSMEIHNFLMKKVVKDEIGRDTWFWIGGSDKEIENTWKWVDGSPWNFTHWASEPDQQPNRAATGHDCLQIYHNSLATNGWNDQGCRFYHNFICSWKICPGKIDLGGVVTDCM